MERTLSLATAVACAALTLLVQAPARADTAPLADLSLQELADLPVTSVSKRPEPLAQAAAAIYVISNDDIRRSGVRTLLGALRLAPNLQVAQANNQTWAIGARGNNASTTDKFLVLIDGRIVYSPLFSGTFWDSQNVMLEDVDHIEVISGPGGTLWGTNAVNGVINIITRKAQDSKGPLAAAGAGRRGGNSEARYGGDIGDDGSYRVYGMVSDDYHTTRDTDMPMPDGQNLAQAGFRSDWLDTDRQYTLQGDAYKRDEDNALPFGGIRISGMNLLSRWQDKLSGGSDLSVLAYYDHTLREAPGNYDDREDIGNVELQQALPQIGAQSLTWGASYRYVMDDFDAAPTSGLNFQPAAVNQNWGSLYAQNESAISDTLRGILGLRLERNPYTGSEWLPNARLAWDVNDNSLAWAAVSRAVRSPSRLDVDLNSPQQPPFFLVGNPNFESEVVKVYEAGFRSQPSPDFSYSVNAYHNYSDNLRTENVLSTQPFQVTFANGMTWSTTGINAWATYKLLDNWRLQAGFMTQKESQHLQATAVASSISAEGNDPSNQWSLRSSYDFSDGVEFDVTARHVGALPDAPVPAYSAVDIRIGIEFGRAYELSMIGSNLFYPSHIEFGPKGTAEFGRSYYLRLTWRP
ncbi:MAG TPA: TonB-dependent receptor [Gammaproteobacteria bacterium]|jgi:iron complex outermembrane receptor protein|nr:TonB-dependent receptor [Gammaproteobacteria bacterium]